MEINSSSFQRELDTAVEAAKAAGSILDNYREGSIDIKDTKTDKTDIVTQADEDAQERIVDEISRVFPNDDFLGEENLKQDTGSSRTWIIDPIDGTSNFQKGHEYFCTSIALEVDDEVKVGVVYSPESGLNEMFYSVEGEGAYRAQDNRHQKLHTSDQKQIEGSLLQITMITRISEKRHTTFHNIIDELRKKEFRHLKQGCLVLSGCKVAQGIFDGTIQCGWKWDFAASKLIQREAGGMVRHREKHFDGLDETVTSNGNIQDELEKLLDEAKEAPD